MTQHFCDRCKRQIKFPSKDGRNYNYEGKLFVTASIIVCGHPALLLCLHCLGDIIEDDKPVKLEDAQ